jgi:CheY-like chemotaxis protein
VQVAKTGSPGFVPVLYAEDDGNDIFFMAMAFGAAGVENPLIAVQDGQEAIDYLSGHGDYSDRRRCPFPCLLLTDIKMPRMDGFELLDWLKQRAAFRDLPKIVLSSSVQEPDLRRAGELGACSYFMKPTEHTKLTAIVREWQRTVLTPHCCTAPGLGRQ